MHAHPPRCACLCRSSRIVVCRTPHAVTETALRVNAVALRVLTPRRLRLYPLAMFGGAAIGFLVFLAGSSGLRGLGGGRVGGDFPAFYGAARIIRSGDWKGMYEPATLQRAQAEFFPDQPGGWLTFPYPPFVAAAYVPLTLFSFKTAYALHSLIMAACCVAALALLLPALPRLRGSFLPCAAATLTFYPMVRAVMGGQNTALSLLCASGAAAALARRKDVLAGVWLGAWMFKPQLALPVTVVVAIAGHPKVVAGATISAATLYLAGAAITEPTWPIWWVRDILLPYAAAGLSPDLHSGASFTEVARELGMPALGWIAIGVVVVVTLRTVWRTQPAPVVLVGIASPFAVLVAPHALFYDAGLALMAFAAAAAVSGRTVVPLLLVLWALAALEPMRMYLPLPPSTVVLLGSLLISIRIARRAADERPPLDDSTSCALA